MNLVDNVVVRRAVAEFAAAPGQQRALDVLRSCMYGELLFDITGSDAFADNRMHARGRLQIRGGTGPGGGRALFAFTRHEEINRLHPPGTQTQSLATPATGALALAKDQRDAWLYIDPAGPTCALSAAEIDFALRNPNNEPVKTALAELAAGRISRHAVVELLRQPGPLMLAADDSVPGNIGVRTATRPDGSSILVAFTSAPEVVAWNPSDAVMASTTLKVFEMLRARLHHGVVVNPAGPSIELSAAEILS